MCVRAAYAAVGWPIGVSCLAILVSMAMVLVHRFEEPYVTAQDLFPASLVARE